MRSHPNRSRVAKRAVATAATIAHDHDRDYSALLAGVTEAFSVVANTQLFTTDAKDLFTVYLDALPPEERQLHNCHACRKFIERFGGLVMIIEHDGGTMPAMWEPSSVPGVYAGAFTALHNAVIAARVTGVFLSSDKIWGTPVTGEWSHIAVLPHVERVYRERGLTAKQRMAEIHENFRNVKTAISEFTSAMLDQALRVLEAGAVSYSEHFVAPVRWLRELHDRPKGRAGENLLWRAVAEAPEGFCHPRAAVTGTLLEDIAENLHFELIRARFNAKVCADIYQRPQAAPSAGNIAAAEALVEKLGIARSLERRFARLDEIEQKLWVPSLRVEPPGSGGVFSNIKPKRGPDEVQPVELPAVTMTWDKFIRSVLPQAERLDLQVPTTGRFIALTTAVHADAPPILKWDREDERNPIGWYLHHPIGAAHMWNLVPGTWTAVNAIVPFPTLWGSPPMPFLADGMILILEGCVDQRINGGNALFPQMLLDELYGARAVIEAYSRDAVLAGRDVASACGYDIRKAMADCVVRAFTAGSWQIYRIDRWD